MTEQIEKEIINKIIIDKEIEATRNLKPEHFDCPLCRMSFDLILKAVNIGKFLSYSELKTGLLNYNVDEADALEFVIELSKTFPVALIESHVEALIEKHYKREMMNAGQNLFSAVKNGSVQYEAFVDKIIELKERKAVRTDDYFDLANYQNIELEQIYKRSRFIRTGISSLDEKIAGLWAGQTNIIAGRPGTGKTTLALQIAARYKTLFFSLEMSREELYAKLLSAEAKVESWKIESRKLDQDERAREAAAHKKLSAELRMTVFDKNINYSTLMNHMLTFTKQRRPDLIVLDYIQLVPGAKGENQNIRISEISRMLKLSAMNYNIPVVILSQLNRDIEKSKRPPVLSDLRDSGSLEQDATLVLFLDPTDDEGGLDFRIEKNRKGQVGKIENLVTFDKKYSRFMDSGREIKIKNMDYIHD